MVSFWIYHNQNDKKSLFLYRMGSHRIMEGEHEFFLLCGQPMTSPIRGDLHLMAGRLILRFNFTKLFFVTNSFFNDSRVWLGSGDNGKWTIAHLTPILKMKPYFWFVFGTWDFLYWWRHISPLPNEYVFRRMTDVVVYIIFTTFLLHVPELHLLYLFFHWKEIS